MIQTRKSFKGGYRFKNFRGSPSGTLETVAAPVKVMVPLKRKSEEPVLPVVKSGDIVKAGQIIGRDDESLSSPIHSPISGKVVSVKKQNVWGEKILSVNIEAQGVSDSFEAVEGAAQHWTKIDKEKLEELVYLSGVSALSSAGIPTRFHSSPVSPEDVEEIIIASTDSDLFRPAADVLLAGENGSSFVEGVKILKKLFKNAPVSIVLNSFKRTFNSDLSSRFTGIDRVQLFAVKPKYPQDSEEMLVKTILKKEYPYGYPAIYMGVLVLSVQTVLDLCEAVTKGKPVIRRTITLGGEGFNKNHYLDVPIGMAIEEVVNGKLSGPDNRIIQNSLNNGEAVEDLSTPILWETEALISIPETTFEGLFPFAAPGFLKDSFSSTFPSRIMPVMKKLNTNIHGEERACIQCGFCSDVCPEQLLPNLLYRYVERNIIEDSLVNFRIFHCIECNLCTYVCTSKLPVSAVIKEGKEKLAADGIDGRREIAETFQLKGLKVEEGQKR